MAGGNEEPLVTEPVSFIEAAQIEKRRMKNGLTGQYLNRKWVNGKGWPIAFSSE